MTLLDRFARGGRGTTTIVGGGFGTAGAGNRHRLAEVPNITSSVITLKPARVHGPNEITIATSVASRPRAIRMRPMRGTWLRGSKAYQRPPRNASNHAAKSPG